MPNVAKALREEIVRLARKEAHAAVAPMRKPTAGVRRSAADLKRRVATLERAVRQILVVLTKMQEAQPATETPQEETRARITAKGIGSLRQRLGLSGRKFGKLLGVTGQAVYNMEKAEGTPKLRASTRAAILAIRGMGAREARQRLAEMTPAEKAKRPSGKHGKARAPRRRK